MGTEGWKGEKYTISKVYNQLLPRGSEGPVLSDLLVFSREIKKYILYETFLFLHVKNYFFKSLNAKEDTMYVGRSEHMCEARAQAVCSLSPHVLPPCPSPDWFCSLASNHTTILKLSGTLSGFSSLLTIHKLKQQLTPGTVLMANSCSWKFLLLVSMTWCFLGSPLSSQTVPSSVPSPPLHLLHPSKLPCTIVWEVPMEKMPGQQPLQGQFSKGWYHLR